MPPFFGHVRVIVATSTETNKPSIHVAKLKTQKDRCPGILIAGLIAGVRTASTVYGHDRRGSSVGMKLIETKVEDLIISIAQVDITHTAAVVSEER